MIETLEQIGGRRLTEDETFKFACRPELACFNQCCRYKRLPLWPYDVLRLRQSLDLLSFQILETFAELEFDPQSGWPTFRLRLDDQGRCPFVTADGCRVYPHRPAACRIYPLARAVRRRWDGLEVVYVRQNTKGCLGWEQEQSHTCESWDLDQGSLPYHQANDQLFTLLFHSKRKGRLDLNSRQTHAVIAALYNLDIFRQMITRPEFPMNLTQDRLEKALGEDEELLLLGRDFLIERLFEPSEKI